MPKIHFDFDKLAKGSLDHIGTILVKQAKGNMNKTSYGKTYIIGGKVHIASRVGDSPNNLSGALNKSIRFEIHGRKMKFGAGNESIRYAKFLELGTRKMSKRPNYTKSIMQNKHEIDLELKRLFEKSIRWGK